MYPIRGISRVASPLLAPHAAWAPTQVLHVRLAAQGAYLRGRHCMVWGGRAGGASSSRKKARASNACLLPSLLPPLYLPPLPLPARPRSPAHHSAEHGVGGGVLAARAGPLVGGGAAGRADALGVVVQAGLGDAAGAGGLVAVLAWRWGWGGRGGGRSSAGSAEGPCPMEAKGCCTLCLPHAAPQAHRSWGPSGTAGRSQR